MSKILLAIISMLSFATANAQSFKVVKIQGKKAIVEVSDPSMITLNKSYEVGGGGGSSTMSSGPTSFKRDNAIEASFVYVSGNSASAMSLGGTYLWNMKTYEVGPTVGLTNTTVGSVSSNSTAFGAKGFYNFNENKVGVETVLSALGKVTMESGAGSSVTNISLGGNYRWFLLSGDHCFSFSALYNMQQRTGGSTSNFSLEAAIATYF